MIYPVMIFGKLKLSLVLTLADLSGDVWCFITISKSNHAVPENISVQQHTAHHWISKGGTHFVKLRAKNNRFLQRTVSSRNKRLGGWCNRRITVPLTQ